MTDLWTRFQSAVRWLVEGSSAAVRTINAAPNGPMVLLGYDDTLAVAPELDTDGMDIRGVRTVDLAAEFSTAGESIPIRIYLFNGAWYASGEDITVTAPDGETNVFLNPLDVESWQRIYVRILTPPMLGIVTVRACPEAE